MASMSGRSLIVYAGFNKALIEWLDVMRRKPDDKYITFRGDKILVDDLYDALNKYTVGKSIKATFNTYGDRGQITTSNKSFTSVDDLKKHYFKLIEDDDLTILHMIQLSD